VVRPDAADLIGIKAFASRMPGIHRSAVPPPPKPAPGYPTQRPELTCPAGGLPALKAAVDNGADCVYVGFRDETNARTFCGVNFDVSALREGIAYVHRRGRKLLVALNTFPSAAGWPPWCIAGIDVRIDCGGRLTAAEKHFPDLPRLPSRRWHGFTNA